MTTLRDDLSKTVDALKDRFAAERRVLSFDEYLTLFAESPARHSRDAVRYVRDCVAYFGSYDVARPGGPARRWRVFDQPFDDKGPGARREYLVGQEAVQEAFVRTLENLVREGRANRLTLLHGPNGSAKSTFAACLMRALEAYSRTDEGALYSFAWIFPRGRDGRGAIGFGGLGEGGAEGSYAHLPEAQIDAKLTSPLREHPLHLLPVAERRALLAKALDGSGKAEPLSEWISSGQLGARNERIFEALWTAYRGDLGRVLAHVQVERYSISRRYRVGAVTIGPQMAVDASERQITADRSAASLPASLSSLSLFEPYGELVDAEGGLLEFSDLLKRPLDAWKYLLIAIETGEVALPTSILPMNCVMIASSNELHLSAFREHPEFNSFRGRLSLVRVPYLLSYRDEQAIYDSQLVPQIRRHVAPHATFVAALWAVLTRLRRPQPDRYESKRLGRLAAELHPLEKADAYADGTIPSRLSTEDAQELRNGLGAVLHETDPVAHYEGLSGASPREIRTLLLDAAQDETFACLSPLAVLARLAELVDQGDHDFLKETADRGYHDARAFLGIVRGRWLDRVDDELRTSTGLVEEARYLELFDRYVTHVSYWVKNERVHNRVTGKYEDPDLELMTHVEKTLDAGEDRSTFRRDLISVVAAWAIDHPGAAVEYASLFPRHLARLKEAYFGEHKKELAAVLRDALDLLRGGKVEDAQREKRAQATLDGLRGRFGYEHASAKDALAELAKERYGV